MESPTLPTMAVSPNGILPPTRGSLSPLQYPTLAVCGRGAGTPPQKIPCKDDVPWLPFREPCNILYKSEEQRSLSAMGSSRSAKEPEDSASPQSRKKAKVYLQIL